MSPTDVFKDVKHSFRMFRKNPAFTIAALSALTLGIGANTAIFSVVDAVMLRPVAFPDAGRLVMLGARSPQGVNGAGSPAKFAWWQAQTDAVRDVSAFRTNVVNDTGNGTPVQIRAGQVSADFFRLFGVALLRGRSFSTDEDRPGAGPVVVLNDAFWTRRFGADPNLVGRSLELGGTSYTVVGIGHAPAGLEEFGPIPDVWVPFQLDPYSSDQGHYFQVAGRLAPDVTIAQANERLSASTAGYRTKFPTALDPAVTFSATDLRTALVSGAGNTLWVLAGAVGLVLLIACANVANLLLARATGRKREMAIRAAVGAGRGRIVRQLLTESVLLSGVGGLLGLGAGLAGIHALLSINTAGLPRLGDNGTLVTVDLRVLLFAVGLAAATGIIFGLIPALHASRADLGSVMKEAGSRSGTGARQNRTRSALVVVEVAVALVLLVGSALLIRTAVALASVDPGFDTSHVLTMRMSLNDPRFATAAHVEDVVREGVDRLRALPGVSVATAACCVPLEGGYGLPFRIVGRPLDSGPFHGGGGWVTVSPGYFEAFKIPVKRGRVFSDHDTAAGIPAVVINEAMASHYWPHGDPLADRLVIGRGVMREFADEPERQIIGVVGDVRDGGLNQTPGPEMYIPQAQLTDAANALNARITPMAWIVRTDAPLTTLRGPIQDALRQATGMPLSEVRSMDEVVDRSTSRERFNMWLMSVFGGSALLLAVIGIYGLMAYSVQQRTQEIGIRLALGADVGGVRRMVVLQALRLALVGVAIGIAATLGLARFIASLVFGVQPRDPLVLAGAPLVLFLVAIAAAWIPARRASRIDPVAALRGD